MDTKQVTVSGAVGKQVFETTKSVILHGYTMNPLSANARIVIRDGNASGDIKHEASVASANHTSHEVIFPCQVKFTKGMHVKLLGTGAVAYLYIS